MHFREDILKKFSFGHWMFLRILQIMNEVVMMINIQISLNLSQNLPILRSQDHFLKRTTNLGLGNLTLCWTMPERKHCFFEDVFPNRIGPNFWARLLPLEVNLMSFVIGTWGWKLISRTYSGTCNAHYKGYVGGRFWAGLLLLFFVSQHGRGENTGKYPWIQKMHQQNQKQPILWVATLLNRYGRRSDTFGRECLRFSFSLLFSQGEATLEEVHGSYF